MEYYRAMTDGIAMALALIGTLGFAIDASKGLVLITLDFLALSIAVIGRKVFKDE